MGELAEAVLQAGGEVIGIEPGFFVDSCLQHDTGTPISHFPGEQGHLKRSQR